jgi:hypothetical protein
MTRSNVSKMIAAAGANRVGLAGLAGKIALGDGSQDRRWRSLKRAVALALPRKRHAYW